MCLKTICTQLVNYYKSLFVGFLSNVNGHLLHSRRLVTCNLLFNHIKFVNITMLEKKVFIRVSKFDSIKHSYANVYTS